MLEFTNFMGFIGCLATALCFFHFNYAYAGWPKLLKKREPHTLEVAYSYLAGEAEVPQLCEKISPKAISGAPFDPRGYQISLTKSECYYNAAITMRDDSLCEKVKPKNTIFLDGSKYSESECIKEVSRKRIQDAKKKRKSIAIVQKGDMHLVSKFLGYQFENQSDYIRNYFDVDKTSDDFRHRLDKLPDFSKHPINL